MLFAFYIISLSKKHHMKRALLYLTLLTSLKLSGAIEIETVLVNDAGNLDDFYGYGGVAYNFYIGTYEVTNAQYSAFLNAMAADDPHGLYHPDMSGGLGGITRSGEPGGYAYSTISGRENHPVNYVSFWDAARFANWLSTGDTESGVYNLGGISSPVNGTITRNEGAWANGGVAIASEDEWYKAAYYSGSPTGTGGDEGDSLGYWTHPKQGFNLSAADFNINNQVGDLTAVGNYISNATHYGTFDQGGNVFEWNDSISGSGRGQRGGDYTSSIIQLQSSVSFFPIPVVESAGLGFRVSSLAPINSEPPADPPDPDVSVVLEMSTDGLTWASIDPGVKSIPEPVVHFRASLSPIGSLDLRSSSPATVPLAEDGGTVDVELTRSSDLNEWNTSLPGDYYSKNRTFFRAETSGTLIRLQGGTLATSNEFDGTSVDTFFMGKYEVTWKEWRKVRDWAVDNGYEITPNPAGCAENHPVHTVSSWDVLKWCNARSEMLGLTPVYSVSGATFRTGNPDHTTIARDLLANGYRLPTEPEWEFAASGGVQTDNLSYSGSNDLNEVGWYQDNSAGAMCDLASTRGTWPVGQKLPNELGLYDMSGNVSEWCFDNSNSSRPVRGGNWNDTASSCEVSARRFFTPGSQGTIIGFRMARSLIE